MYVYLLCNRNLGVLSRMIHTQNRKTLHLYMYAKLHIHVLHGVCIYVCVYMFVRMHICACMFVCMYVYVYGYNCNSS